MSLFDAFKKSIRGEDPVDWIPDFIAGEDSAKRLYLKLLAKDTVLNFVARTMSTMKVKFKNKTDTADWDYILNVRPNKDMSAASFWQKFFYTLLADNEVLVVFTDDNQLLIADDFTRTEYAVYDDIFSGVMVKDYIFNRTFAMSDVIYLEYNNDKLDRFDKGLFDDYGELFGRIVEIAMRNNQIRGTVTIDSTGNINDDKGKDGKTRTERLQEFINKVYDSFKSNSVAIVPKVKGFEYEEYTNKQGVSNQSLDELNKMITSLIDVYANAIGVPTALIYGEKSELDSNIKAMRKTCTSSLVEKIQDELIAKILTRQEYINGERVKITNVLPISILENATQIDKIVASGTFLRDEVRNEVDYDPLLNGEGRRLIMTKNYDYLKGGENNNDEN
ncbi:MULTISPECIES: phage portal protein [unclassified Enterococcus]|uniref:phage portal protein n=1 Tax=unclassified Enterococcus TaxID=2608891 RepID=UPI00155615B2|nr:phage portal protein [Enterococcus sp. MMGLQ5-2]MBS7585490.1 phage portal protein [Enterococcus sp. MMGLQ5-1]NPD13347.1 phage portal protein [Enterococcus sp. MMGLQ5-1]NPD38130.1 phage portal protein [Enterococcus sp. MMGLQ5-2]